MDKDERSSGRRRWAPRIGLVLAAVIAVVLASLIWMRADMAKPAATQPPAPPIPVQTAVVTPQVVEITRTALGTVSAWNTATITPQVSGQIVELAFEEGGLVHAGDVLV